MIREDYRFFREEMIAEQKNGTCFSMANEEIATRFFQEGKQEFPNLTMYKVGNQQFFCASIEAQKKFEEFLKKRIAVKEAELLELCEALEAVRQNKF